MQSFNFLSSPWLDLLSLEARNFGQLVKFLLFRSTIFSSLDLLPWRLLDLDDFWHTHSWSNWRATCKVSTSWAPFDSRFCPWKQSKSGISWNLIFLVWPLFSSLALLPWESFVLDEFWHKHNGGKWLSYMKRLDFLRSPWLKVLWSEAE